METSRRELLHFAAGAPLALVAKAASCEEEEPNWPPRLIYNNDGVDHPASPTTPESFLAERTTALAASEVDLITK